jgi:uncharacterized membrane protein YeaQ/YmgE (transglycosylase-associated protein family)
MTLANFIYWLILGAVAGWLAGVLVRGGGFGLIGDIIVGIIGSVVGGFVFGLLGITAFGLLGQLLFAVVGAVIFICLIRLVKRA